MASLFVLNGLPPLSKEEAIEQARVSLWQVLEAPLKRRMEPATIRLSKKQAQLQQQSRFRIEIPVQDSSEKTLASLALDLLHHNSEFPAAAGAPKISVFVADQYLHDTLTAAIASDSRTLPQFIQLSSLIQEEEQLSVDKEASFIFILAPTTSQAGKVKSLVSKSGKRAVIVVNPEWSGDQEDVFQVAYSFTPLSIQSFFSRTEGAMLKQVPLSSPWRVYVKEGDDLSCVLNVNRRPSSTDLETILYNRVAAKSPLVKTAKLLSGIFKNK